MSTFILPGAGTMYLLYPPLVGLVHKSQVQGRTQGGVGVNTPPLELDILQKLYYKGNV